MKSAVKGSRSTPKNKDMLPKIIVNFESLEMSEVSINTMCGNIDEKCINLIVNLKTLYCTMCGNELKTIEFKVLCVEMRLVTKTSSLHCVFTSVFHNI